MNIFNFISAGALPDWVTTSFPIIRMIMIIAIVVMSIILAITVLIQQSTNDGMGAIAGQSTDTYYSKNKKGSLQGVLTRLTVGLGIAIAVLSILFFVTLVIYPAF